MNEEWRAVVGYEGLYEVSELGNVRSLGRTCRTRWGERFQRGKTISVYVDKTSHGYRCCTLLNNGQAKKQAAHVLVLEAFRGPRPSGYEGCHNDGDRTNCRLGNLRWDTPAANRADMLAHGTRARGEQCRQAVLTSELVEWIRESKQSSLALAPILQVASSTIRAARLGANWA